ncbi:MAG: hypothetical protein ACRCU5_08970 [Rhizobiaceae bacterium]
MTRKTNGRFLWGGLAGLVACIAFISLCLFLKKMNFLSAEAFSRIEEVSDIVLPIMWLSSGACFLWFGLFARFAKSHTTGKYRVLPMTEALKVEQTFRALGLVVDDPIDDEVKGDAK